MEAAKENMLKVIKHVNDVMHQIAITGYKGDISLLGNLLMQVNGPLVCYVRLRYKGDISLLGNLLMQVWLRLPF